ncbi:hypothetical protein [Roseivirga sp.]|uniref:hypothetical protein n=1 Tax=Roseivirga sp. TaxID=1964215 RepID=UPI003B52E22A
MNTQERDKIAQLLSKKIDRQNELRKKAKELELLNEELLDTKFFRSINSTYLFLKRGLLWIVGISLSIFAIVTLIFPSLIGGIFDVKIQEALYDFLRFFSTLILISGLTLLYISSMTRKIRLRNQQLTQAETVTRQIISNYRSTIQEEDRQINSLNEILKTFLYNSSTNSSSHTHSGPSETPRPE